MTNEVRLRDYQRAAIDGIHRAWRGEPRGTGTGVVNRVAVALPTGAGKTVVFSHPDLRESVIGTGARGRRMLILVHREELAGQTIQKLRSIDPSAVVGRVQAEHDQVDAKIVVASVQTLARRSRRDQIKDVGLIVADEAHHYTSKTYLETLTHYGAFRGIPTVGFSATLTRSDDRKLGDLWEELVIRKDIIEGIRAGWLVDVRGKTVAIEGLDLAKVQRTRGDYADGALGAALHGAHAAEQVAEAYKSSAMDRQGAAFWPDVASAQEGAEAFNSTGIPSEVVIGETPTDVRQAIYARTRAGVTQVIHSCMVLTEGFDMPQLDCAVIARPTQNNALYVQMVGRVLRPWRAPRPGFGVKRDALVLDVAGVAGKHKLATLADLSPSTKLPREDQSLLESEDEPEDEPEDDIPTGPMSPKAKPFDFGAVTLRDADLFSESAALWQQTPRGTWFVSVGSWFVFLWPMGGGLWTVGRVGQKGGLASAELVQGDLTFEWAMARAEREADTLEGMQTLTYGVGRSASWRQGSRPASDAQRGYARSLGIAFDAGTSKSQLADMITTKIAARVLGG
jgi:superfamily II DNA or RNA helicase